MQESALPLEEKKKGPKPKVSQEDYEALLDRVEMLEACLCKIATDAGQGNILPQYGLKRVNPTGAEMRKYV